MTELWRDEVHEKDRKEKLATYLFAMKEDLSEWIAGLMNIPVTADTFMTTLDSGVHLCRLANMIQKAAQKYLSENPQANVKLPASEPKYTERGANYGSFFSRDNVANFIRWCREFGIADVIIFESDDLVLHNNQKHVILTLLDVARRASKFDIEPPDLVIMEEQIDEEIALEEKNAKNKSNDLENMKNVVAKSKTPASNKKKPKKLKNFIPKNLDTLVKEIVEEYTCKESFPIEKLADGKYKIGENRVLIFVRVMRNHVMVRVGGGWDTLENYIQKHHSSRMQGRPNHASSNASKHRFKTQTPPLHDNEPHSSLQSLSYTSIGSSDSNSSTSSVTRLSPVNGNDNNLLQGMMCVYGESSGRSEKDVSPLQVLNKQTFSPSSKNNRRPLNTSTRQTPMSKGLGSKHGSVVDTRNGILSSSKKKPDKTPDKKTQTLRASVYESDLSFNRSRTSDAILNPSKRLDILSTPLKLQGNLSRESSSSKLKQSRNRNKNVATSSEVRRRSEMSPSNARRKLEKEYEGKEDKNKKDLRKALNDHHLLYSRSFSADTIIKGRYSSVRPSHGHHNSPSRIPVPVTNFGKPRGFSRISNNVSPSVNHASPPLTNGVNGAHSKNTNSSREEECTSDEGFIDGDTARTLLCPTGLFHNSKTEELNRNCEEKKENGEHNNNVEYNDSGLSGDCWKEVMTDMIKLEEDRISDQNI